MSADAPPRARRPLSFWRGALGAGLAAGAFAFLPSATPSPHGAVQGMPFTMEASPGALIDSVRFGGPGAAPLALLAAALVIVGPPRRIEQHGRTGRAAIILAAIGFALPAMAAWVWATEVEAAVLSLPYLAFAIGALILGWRFRQQDEHLPLVALLGAGVLRVALSTHGEQALATEQVWWATNVAWAAAVLLWKRDDPRDATDAAPPALLAAVGLFVVGVLALTIQTYFHPTPELWTPDSVAARRLVAGHLLGGVGLGGFDRALAEYIVRPPGLGRAAASGGWRMLAEWGAPACAVLAIALGMAIHDVRSGRAWTRARVIGAGLVALWSILLLATRSETHVPLAVICLALPTALGRVRPPVVENEDRVPPHAVAPWAVALVTASICAIGFPLVAWHYERQGPQESLDAQALLPQWSKPWRDRAWLVRHRSVELATYTDPRREMRPAVEAWMAIAPHDEFAHVESARLAEKEGGDAFVADALAVSCRRLPWSDTLILWRVRTLRDSGRLGEALRFLEDVQSRRAGYPLPPAMARRLIELRIEARRMTRSGT